MPFETLDRTTTRDGHELVLYRQNRDFYIYIDGQELMSSCTHGSERALAEIGCRHLETRRNPHVLIGGLGLGYTADAALRCEEVQSVEVIELLGEVIGWLQDGLLPLSETLVGDARLQIVEGDGYRKMWQEPTSTYDLILIDIDHSPDDRLGAVDASFYSDEGLKKARRHLAPGGVIGIWSYEENQPFADAMAATFDDVRIEPVTHENVLIDQTQTDWLYFGRVLESPV